VNALLQISVVIPAFNEARAIEETIRQVRRTFQEIALPHEIVVVDDGSSDGTAAVAEAAGAVVLKHPENLGYGASLKTGIKLARFPWIAITDADGTYPASEFPNLLRHVPAFDMVVGARTGTNFKGGPFKQIGRVFFKFFSQFVTGRNIPDINSGMRVFRRDFVLSQINQISSGFSFTTTLTLSMMLEGQFVKYESISYHPRVGSSHVRYFRDTLRATQIIVQAVLWYNPVKMFLLLSFMATGVSLAAALAAIWVHHHALVLLLLWASLMFPILILSLGSLGYIIRTAGLQNAPNAKPTADGCAPQTQSNIQRHA
jgi:glycosyltransferase involved in cell wall biosynthesis